MRKMMKKTKRRKNYQISISHVRVRVSLLILLYGDLIPLLIKWRRTFLLRNVNRVNVSRMLVKIKI